MTSGEFIEVFDTIAEAPGGIERLRELVLQLAVRGKLVPQDSGEESASVLLKRISDEKFRLFREGKLRMPKPLSPIATEEAPFDVPDQWEWVRLGDIANSRLGKMLDKSKNKGPYRRYLRNANVQWFRFDLSDVLELRLENAELEEYSVKENDLIVCEGGEPGRAAVCGPDVDGMVFQKALHRVRPWCGISTWYLAYLLRCDTWSQRINTLFTGATIKHLTGKALATHMVPLPPLSEQYRIVAKIDELMELIDRLVAARRGREDVRTAGRDSALSALRNAATPEEVGTAWTRIAERMDDLFTAPADLTPLREAVLQLAVRGRLVPQDADEEPATVLLDRIVEERAELIKKKKIRPSKPLSPVSQHETSFEIPQSWIWIRLGSLYHLEMGQSPSSQFYNQNGDGLPFYQGKADFGDYFPTVRYWCTEPTKLADKGDVLLSVRAPIGPTNIAMERCCIGRGLAALRPLAGMPTEYLLWTLRAFEKQLDGMGTGTTFKAVSRKLLEPFPLPLPPLAEQHRIVAKVDELMGLIDRLERHLGVKEGIQGDFAGAVCSFAQQGVGHV